MRPGTGALPARLHCGIADVIRVTELRKNNERWGDGIRRNWRLDRQRLELLDVKVSRRGKVVCVALRVLGPSFVAAILGAGCVSASKPFKIRTVVPGIYEGSRPRSHADYEALRARGIRTVLSMEAMPWNVYPEGRAARKAGFKYFNVPVPASPFPPAERRVNEVLRMLTERSLQPIYFHCYLGRDRDALITALYRVQVERWPPEEAWQEMLHSGFKRWWILRGLRVYFWRHCRDPGPLPARGRGE